MAAPNIVNVTTITGKTAVQAIGTSAAAIVSNGASSGQVIKVNFLMISNVDGTNSASFDAEIYRSSTAYRVAYQMDVPAKSSVDVFSKAVYLEEGDSIRLTASAASDLEAVCSYEVIS